MNYKDGSIKYEYLHQCMNKWCDAFYKNREYDKMDAVRQVMEFLGLKTEVGSR